MNKPDQRMGGPTEPVNERTETITSDGAIKPRRIPVAALLNAAAAVAAAVVLTALSGPKIPKGQGE